MSKKIVLLSGLKIFPNISGGHLRSGGVAKSLARLGHEVKVYSIAGRRGDYGLGERFSEQQIEARLHEEIHLGWLVGLLQASARRLGLPRVWQYYLIRSGLVSTRMRKTLSEADLVICDLPYTPPVWSLEKSQSWWMLSHNLEHRLLEQGNALERALAPWMLKVARRAPQSYQQILACAPEDYQFFLHNRRKEDKRIVTLGNGIDPDVYRQASFERRELRASWGLEDEDWLIVFSGSRFQPNLEALEGLRSFVRREAYFLQDKRIHFLILGSLYPESRREGSLIMTGRVPDTVPYFAAADAALNPVLRGSGSNLKIFEYMAARLPILSTGFGIRGTQLQHGRDVLLYDEETFLDRLTELTQERSKEEWSAFAEDVWLRHGKATDMTEIVKQAVGDTLGWDIPSL